MNKLKMSLALIALIIPLLLCAKKRNIEFIKHGNHRIPVESFIPVKAFFDDCNKELTIEFAQDWEAVTIEIKSKEGYVVYRGFYILHILLYTPLQFFFINFFREYSGRNI